MKLHIHGRMDDGHRFLNMSKDIVEVRAMAVHRNAAQSCLKEQRRWMYNL